jgi:hypothetical protein
MSTPAEEQKEGVSFEGILSVTKKRLRNKKKKLTRI